MSDISPSAIRTNQSIDEQVAAASTPSEIAAIMHAAAKNQRLVVPDLYDPNVLLPVEPGTQPRAYVKVVRINGTAHTLEGATEAQLLQAETALYRQIVNPDESREEASRDERGRFTQRDPDPVEEFHGDALDRALAARGIDPAALAEVSNKKFEQSWAEATTAFLQSDSGASWPGGEKNKTILGQILIDNGLVDSPDKLEAISAAFDFARENGLLVPNEEAETLQRINEVTSPSELRALLQPSERQYRVQQGIQSGIWGK